ncbi:hypothetical protein ACIBO5_52260 [Nonomuraea angiospora]|uniref:hypothetical protein n=1 Tax=Nonomuraea angiospora TaxID=46172 RepID=UPI0037A9010E
MSPTPVWQPSRPGTDTPALFLNSRGGHDDDRDARLVSSAMLSLGTRISYE